MPQPVARIATHWLIKKPEESASSSGAPQLTRASEKTPKKVHSKTDKAKEGGPGSGRKGHTSTKKDPSSDKKGFDQAKHEKIMSILDQVEKSGVGFWSRSGDTIHLNIRGSSGNDPDQWINANTVVNALGTSAISGPTPDPQSGHLVISIRSPMRKKESGSFQSRGSLMEAQAPVDSTTGRRFRVVLLREGMGNMSDCFYYTASAIQSSVPIFEGAKFFLNHPSDKDEQDHPERVIDNLSGYFENLNVLIDSDGASSLVGDLVIPPGEAFDRERTLMMESIDYAKKHPGKDLVGLSINASGDFETMQIDHFLEQEAVPESCKPKILEAISNGITTIRPVRIMTSAVSCDLVTVAGAGGRINQILEEEKGTTMKVKLKEEDKKDPKEPKEADKKEDGGADGKDGHADADEDKELISKMLKKHLGDGFTEEDHQMMGEAYQNALEMGMEGEEAMKCAGYNMKAAKHAMQKQKQAAAGNPEGVQDASVPAKDQHSEADSKKEEGEKSLHESEKKVVALMAENARLSQELTAIKLEKFIDKTLQESKLPMTATKKFRECIKEAKTEKEVNEKWAIFKEAFNIRGGEADGFGFVLSAEKTVGAGEGSVDFSDCKDE